MTRKKNTPLSYAPHSVGGEDSDRTGGIETMLQHLTGMGHQPPDVRSTAPPAAIAPIAAPHRQDNRQEDTH